jgi:hypothetical protein
MTRRRSCCQDSGLRTQGQVTFEGRACVRACACLDGALGKSSPPLPLPLASVNSCGRVVVRLRSEAAGLRRLFDVCLRNVRSFGDGFLEPVGYRRVASVNLWRLVSPAQAQSDLGKKVSPFLLNCRHVQSFRVTVGKVL